jgi:iron complex transport system permease protein
MTGTGNKRPPAALVLPLLAAALAGALVLAVARGSVSIPASAASQMMLNALGLGRFPATWSPQEETILLTLRVPHALAAALVGAALATAGALFQGLLRNPLADPYVMGTSGGAAFGAVMGVVLGAQVAFLGFGLVPLLAFSGALGATALVVSLAAVGGRLPVVSVLLAGFAVSTLLGYTVPLLLILDDRLQLQLPRIYGWTLGGVSVSGWQQLGVLAPLVAAAVLAGMGMARTLNAFTLGEEGAARLGIAVERDKRLILALGALLTAAAVSVSGLIGFVGLIVPHAIRLVCGPDHRLLLPASALGGALFLVLADLLARTVFAPAELPVGIVTAFAGGPLFLWLLRRSRREYQW